MAKSLPDLRLYFRLAFTRYTFVLGFPEHNEELVTSALLFPRESAPWPFMTDPIQLLSEYIFFPSVSTDPKARDGMRGAIDFASRRLQTLGFAVEEIPTPLHPILYAERFVGEGLPHILIYGHYDVQPAEPLELWTKPPFEAEVRDNRLYGRGSADNKGPQIVHMAALEQALEKNPDLPLNITYFIEGEEEIGSPSFRGFLKEYKERLAKADFVLLSDTGSPSPDQIVITTALRGLVSLQVELTGPRMDLHSGIHGGAVRNPIQALATLLATLHKEDGSVNLPGFYDGVSLPEPWEREELSLHPSNEEEYAEFLSVDEFFTAPGYSALEAVRFGPTLEINGIGGGFQGEGQKTVIPSKAFAKITCRLVAGQDAAHIEELLIKCLKERTPSGVRLEVEAHGRGNPYSIVPPGHSNTPSDQSSAIQKGFSVVESAITKSFGKRPLYLREGGSVPIIADLKDIVGLDTIMVGLFTPEDNLHAPDESFHLDILRNGISAFAEVFEELAAKGALRLTSFGS
ncbi:MAG: M20/M25/M40 family metallo-hydrolase [Verrucomicrobiota bacterium]